MANLKRKQDELEEETQDELEEESALMKYRSPQEREIVTINAGGQIIQTRRATLCLVSGSLLAAMFSGRWDDRLDYDDEGRVFLDENPEHIQMIVNHLRNKQKEGPFSPVSPPHVAEDRRDAWLKLLNYYGLVSFFYPSEFLKWMSSNDIDFILRPDTDTDVTWSKTEGRLEFEFPAQPSGGTRGVDCRQCLPEARIAWKVTLNNHTPGGFMFLGVCMRDTRTKFSFFGWGNISSKPNKMYVYSGEDDRDGRLVATSTGFAEGDCLQFLLEDGKLTMTSLLQKRRFIIQQIPAGEKFMVFNFGCGAPKLTVEDVDEYELALSAWYN